MDKWMVHGRERIAGNLWYSTHTQSHTLTHSLWSCAHDGTALCRALLCDGPIQHVDLIEEVNS